MFLLILLICTLSFLATFLLIPLWIKAARKAGITGKDMNKYKKPKVAEIGGICVVAGFLVGILAYVAIITFYFKSLENLIEIFSLISTILIITLVGLADDVLGWKLGIRQRYKPLLCLVAAIPLMVINAGESIITIPFIGAVNVGLLYPLLLVPLAIVGASNGFNMLAGYNGLEAGMGIIILSALGILTWKINIVWIALISFCAVASLLAFFFYNKYPAKIFPGDTLTYSIGVLIACVAILGNVEKAALILFLPYFAEFFLKARGKFNKESFAIPQKDNSLEKPYKKIYGLEHATIVLLKKIKKKVYEKDVVHVLWLVEIIIAILILI